MHPTEKPLESEASGDEEAEGTGVLDVLKAIAPLLIIIVISLGMLVLGYVFLPETLSTSICTLFLIICPCEERFSHPAAVQHTSTSSPSGTVAPPPTPEGTIFHQLKT